RRESLRGSTAPRCRTPSFSSENSPARVFVKEGEHLGRPDTDAAQRKVVPVVRRLADRRINPQTMRHTERREARIEVLAGIERVVVLSVNDEERSAPLRYCIEETSAKRG